VIQTSETCAIGEEVPVIGSKIVFKDAMGALKTHLLKHLLEVGTKAEGTKLWTISETAEHETSILSSRWAFLTGAHTGLKFSGS